MEGFEVKIQLKEDARLIQQKGRQIPIYLQQSVEKEINKLMKQGHIEKANNIDENCFVSPAVITVKKDKSIEIALDSRKFNEITIKRKAKWPNMEELISRISRKIADSSRVVSRSGGGGGGPTCFNIGYSEPTRAESREGSSTPWGSSVGVYPWLPTRVMLKSDWLTTRVVYFCTILTT